MKVLLVAVASVVVLGSAALACDNAAPAATPPGVSTAKESAPDSPNAPSANASPEGGECSDDVAIQKKCAPGLVCGSNPKAPISEHTPGICKKP